MRFTNNVDLMQVLKYSAQRLTRILTVPVTNGYRKIRRILNPNGFTTRVMADVRKGGRELIAGKPQSLKDYFSVGNYYIAKKLAFLIAVLVIVLPVLYLKFLHPVIQSAFLTRTMVVNSLDMTGYTGKVRLLSAEHGTLLYQGPMADGRLTGEGKLYDYEGRPVYQGGFQMELYEGQGQTFWPGGGTHYRGGFAANQYEGRGLLYRENGSLLYDGAFVAGQYEGRGVLYAAEGVKQYEGDFKAGKYDGTGTLYSRNGSLLYEGGFAAGRYQGEGVLYHAGQVLYRGTFQDGRYEGTGTLYQDGTVLYMGSFAAGEMEGAGRLYSGQTVVYDGAFSAGRFQGAGREYDSVTGALLYDGAYVSGRYEGSGKLYAPDGGGLLYEGAFYQGVYEGDGKLYAPGTGYPLYEGGFRAGRYDGTGVEYDETLGAVRYEGGFLLGVYHGTGTLYDPVTGFVTAAGEFRNGVLVTVDAAGNVTGPVGAPELPPPPQTPGGEGEVPGTAEPTAPPEGGGGTPPAETQGPETPPPSGGAQVYQGPRTADGAVDYGALAKLDAAAIRSKFSIRPSTWDLPGGGAAVYADQTEHIGVTVRTGADGKTESVDVWNDAPVAGAKAGMSRAELTRALGEPSATRTETMGAGRMVSVSQSNRFFGRLTNLSPESKVTVLEFQTDSGTIQAVFAPGLEQCLLLELLP